MSPARSFSVDEAAAAGPCPKRRRCRGTGCRSSPRPAVAGRAAVLSRLGGPFSGDAASPASIIGSRGLNMLIPAGFSMSAAGSSSASDTRENHASTASDNPRAVMTMKNTTASAARTVQHAARPATRRAEIQEGNHQHHQSAKAEEQHPHHFALQPLEVEQMWAGSCLSV